MSIIDSNKIQRLRDVLNSIFRESGLQPKEIMRMVDYGSRGYNTLLNPYRKDGFEIPYALYFLPEHIPKVFIVMNELRNRFCDRIDAIEEIVDVGCGVGTSGIAYNIFFEDKKQLYLIDRDSRFLGLAEKILKRLNVEGVKISLCDYAETDIVSNLPALYFFTNTISENPKKIGKICSLIERILKGHKENIIVIIEPLNINGREVIIRLRSEFSDHILMPCISPGDCPLIKSEDQMCQYNIRQEISRNLEVVISSGHRMAKFYYLVLCNDIVKNRGNLFRILGYPVKRPYGFDVRMCNQELIVDLKIKISCGMERRVINGLSPNDVILLDPSAGPISNRPVEFSQLGITKIS